MRCKVSEGRNADGHCFFDNQHWSPRHWRRHHRVLVDVCEPLGEPDLFLTVSPWEWTFPFPFWITKAHHPLGKGLTAIPCPETLCNANALQQLCEFFWLEIMRDGRIMHSKTEGKTPGVRAFFGRFEFQEKGLVQEFGKGRGSPNVHCLYWLDNVLDILLRRHSQRTMMNSAQLHSEFSVDLMTRELRCDTNPSSTPRALPLKSGQSICHTIGQWFTSRPRRCIAPLLRLSRCSQDVQCWHGRGAPLRYVAGYATHYGEALTNTERHSVRRCMCRSWKAAAPQMVMALAREAMSFNSVQSKFCRSPSFETFEGVAFACIVVAMHRICTSTFTDGYELTLSGGVSMRAALAATGPRRTCLPQWRWCASTSHATNSSGSGW